MKKSNIHVLLIALSAAAVSAGCSALTYTSPSGESFTRRSFGTTTAVASLAVETGTNGVRRVEMQGYQNDSTQAVGTVVEAAIRAAIQGAK